MNDKIKIGVSACLIGENVRWNGGHKWDHFLTDTLGQYVEYVPVCPEVECGLGIPRETLRLVGDADAPRLVTTRTNIDHTERMQNWAGERLKRLEAEDLCGFIFKSDSPSSGMMRVKVYNNKGMPEKKGIGIFARAFMEKFPAIPVEEEGRLHDPKLRENFIESIFTLKRWRDALKQPAKMNHLVEFHTRHKLLFLSHSNTLYKEMGKQVAQGAKSRSIADVYAQYEKLMMETLSLKTTIKKNINVLQHIMGYFKQNLTADEKSELLEVINQYREEHVPLIVPITLINHYARKYKEPYLTIQTYLNPHPVALKLRNHS
ncbi:MAG: DUF523 and DUF1722 domain-containing protein [Desulfobacterales bacterium]|jgi:uncharacterized protein YbgA (DUF1722 family)/uncharacterized protein YbbK (DUF523 family)|nr:DUF523 and DUF1722 domain-containing protein [Desulfobacterales bacterium]